MEDQKRDKRMETVWGQEKDQAEQVFEREEFQVNLRSKKKI